MLKQFAWFIFKSPQRKWVGWKTLLVDIKGIWRILFHHKKAKNEPIWICVGVKNRNEPLFNHLLKSMKHSKDFQQFALSVFDMGNDEESAEEPLKRHWSGKGIYRRDSAEKFNRSAAFNEAVEQAISSGAEWIFTCDADISLPNDFGQLFRKMVRRKVAWFPICQWQLELGSPAWKWFPSGTGLSGFHASDWQTLQGYRPEEFKEWGKEDWDLFFRTYAHGIYPHRSRVQGLLHHWHPSLKPSDYKPWF